MISPAVHLVHRRRDVYPDPQVFRPERFLDGAGPPPAGWLPFGGGPRRCIGASFARLEMRETLRATFTQARLEPASSRPERPRRRTVTSVPARGTRIVVR